MNYAINLTNKTLREMTPKDTLYVKKIKSGFQIIYYCRFVEIHKGMVIADIISGEEEWQRQTGVIKARSYNCALYGQGLGEAQKYFHWFSSLDLPAGKKQGER